jgi:hypothetical protein
MALKLDLRANAPCNEIGNLGEGGRKKLSNERRNSPHSLRIAGHPAVRSRYTSGVCRVKGFPYFRGGGVLDGL